MRVRRYLPDFAGVGARRRPGSRVLSSRTKVPLSHLATVEAAAAPASLPTAPENPAPSGDTVRRWTRGRIARWAVAAAGLIVIAGVAWAGITMARFQGRIYRELPPTPTAAAVVVQTTRPVVAAVETPVPTPTVDRLRDLPPGRFNVLVLGTDKRPDDPDHWPRSDTLLLANVDTVSRTVRIMSIPRDLIVEIPGYGENKVNAAYLFGEYYKEPGGGQALSVRTVSQLFDVPIKYYVAVNFDGFRKVIDAVGGITVDVPYTLDDYDYPTDDVGDPYGTTHVHFDAGLQQMDGKTALRYARTRHADNDFARSRRQLQIINAVRQKAMSLDLLPKAPGLIEDLGGMIETNIPFDQQLALAQLGYNLAPSGIITASIDASMIVPKYLDDGSEGFGLDWDVAGPMLDEFFGAAVASGDGGAQTGAQVSQGGKGSTDKSTSKSASGAKTGGSKASPSARPTATPTPKKKR